MVLWTKQEVTILKKTYPTGVPLQDIAKKLGKSCKAVRHKAARVMLSRPKTPINKPKNQDHRNEYDKDYYTKYKERISLNKKRRIQRYKENLIKLLGGGCQNCSYSRCSAALDFHHKSNNKEYSISNMWHRRSKEKILKEAMKCVLICANCHRELHFKGAVV